MSPIGRKDKSAEHKQRVAKGERAILADGTQVYVLFTQPSIAECYRSDNFSFVGSLQLEDWKWKCPPESLQR